MLSVAIGEQQRAYTAAVLRDQQLGDRPAAVVGDHINAGYRQRIEQRQQHFDLGFGRTALSVGDLRVAHAEKIGRDATAVRGQARQRPAPLETIQGEPVQKQSYRARATFHVGDIAEARLQIPARFMERAGIRTIRKRLSHPE
jgi:hypothetical protein